MFCVCVQKQERGSFIVHCEVYMCIFTEFSISEFLSASLDTYINGFLENSLQNLQDSGVK